MGDEAPRWRDRVLLAVASGPVGHAVGTALELAAAGATALRSRIHRAVGRPRR